MNLKKPKFWDYKHRNLLAFLLYPISHSLILMIEFYPLKAVDQLLVLLQEIILEITELWY